MDKELKGSNFVQTLVGAGIRVSGRVEGDGDVIIEGRVDGEINIKGDLHVEANGQVKADVRARNIFVQGILVGNAEALEKLEISEGGRMVGDARAPRMLINEGALFRGMVDMVDFETEERNAEGRQTVRRAPRPVAPAPNKRPATRPAPRPATATASFAPPRTGNGGGRADAAPSTEGKGLYNPPPLPKPPEVAGVRKAIIIKKKSTADG